LESLALAYVIPATSNTSNADSIAALNRVLGTALRSFPQYLRWSRPWVPPGHERVLEALERIVNEQDAVAEQAFDVIDNLGGLPDTGEFPMDFTDTHDLSIDYMLREAVGYGRQDVAALESAAATKNMTPQAEPLVNEALQMAKRHLATLEGLSPSSPVV
jgi:bacterioferritin (cytochrome b1)